MKLEVDIPIYVNAGAREFLCDNVQEFAKREHSRGLGCVSVGLEAARKT